MTLRESSEPASVGLIGLGVMGQNLALNMADQGHDVVVYNRTRKVTEEYLAGPASGTGIVGADTLDALVDALQRPRRIVLMVTAGRPVDAVIDSLTPLLDGGDVIVDGGNSHFEDTARRVADLEAKGLLFVGAGISGGEEGARHGPSIMPGGSEDAWPLVRDVLQSIAARVADGTPCCDWIGPGGSGHYVKMVHNGIEYGDIQLLAEAYHLMRDALAMDHDAMAAVFEEWDRGRLDSYLVEITAEVLRLRQDGGPLLERILDAAQQKGTGRWTAESGLALGMPVTLVAEAVFARATSALRDERIAAAGVLPGPEPAIDRDRKVALDDLEAALYASKIVSYTQGFMLLRQASSEYDWDLDLGAIALMWREGCIIRAAFLETIRDAYRDDPALQNLLIAPVFRDAVAGSHDGWRRTIASAVSAGIPVPAYSSALAFYDAIRTERLPANLVQALRDYFGAHTYERVDRPRGERFHTDWAGDGVERPVSGA
ncbi:MAG TPA: decarboxylating NADP(+)-dependent phosphogluconate dehydrogenase [Acidimicrobiia bacterium]|nr:decarboxylating NADP(+)-dependent phosphogluconate dehydrogenase [Acidimicrobiia bacterium]